MARYRTMQIGFWADPYIESLPKEDKLFYLYLITACPNSLGVIERSAQRFSFETGLSASEVECSLSRLESDGKVIRDDGAIWLVNFIKHQSSTSPMIIKKLASDLAGISSAKIRDGVLAKYGALFNGFMDNAIPYPQSSIPYPTTEIPCREQELEREQERKQEPEESSSDEGVVSAQEVVSLWNEMMPPAGFPAVSRVTDERRKKLRARQRTFLAAKSLEFWRRVFIVLQRSSFLSGKNDRHWIARLDFCLQSDEKLCNITEGKYDDEQPGEWVAYDGEG